MTSKEFADYLNKCVMNNADADMAAPENVRLLESRFTDTGGIANIFFAPADSDYDGMAPMARIAQDIRDYYALADAKLFKTVCDAADRIARLSDPEKAVNSVVLPDGVEWKGIPVNGQEALRDLALYQTNRKTSPFMAKI